jgi:hypothetical protein
MLLCHRQPVSSFAGRRRKLAAGYDSRPDFGAAISLNENPINFFQLKVILYIYHGFS